MNYTTPYCEVGVNPPYQVCDSRCGGIIVVEGSQKVAETGRIISLTTIEMLGDS
jgi:hypothetical protein